MLKIEEVILLQKHWKKWLKFNSVMNVWNKGTNTTERKKERKKERKYIEKN